MISIMKKEEFKALQNFEGEYWYLSDRVCDIHSDMEEGYEDDFVEPSDFELKKWAIEDIVNTFKDDINNGHYDEAIIVDDYPVEGSIIVGLELVKVQQDQPIINEMSLDEYNDKIVDKNKFDKFLSNVTKAYTDHEKAVYEVNGIEKYRIYFDGSTQTYMGNRWSSRLKHFKSAKDHHCTLNITVGMYQLGVTVERLIKVAHAVETDSLPYELHHLSVNVMDLSGNESTANKLGVNQDFSLDNLEWTPKEINLAHPKTVLKIKELTGKLYRIPANDLKLPQIVTTHPEIVKEYLVKAGYKVIKEYKGGEQL